MGRKDITELFHTHASAATKVKLAHIMDARTNSNNRAHIRFVVYGVRLLNRQRRFQAGNRSLDLKDAEWYVIINSNDIDDRGTLRLNDWLVNVAVKDNSANVNELYAPGRAGDTLYRNFAFTKYDDAELRFTWDRERRQFEQYKNRAYVTNRNKPHRRLTLETLRAYDLL